MGSSGGLNFGESKISWMMWKRLLENHDAVAIFVDENILKLSLRASFSIRSIITRGKITSISDEAQFKRQTIYMVE